LKTIVKSRGNTSAVSTIAWPDSHLDKDSFRICITARLRQRILVS
jgi:hypothetical protein